MNVVSKQYPLDQYRWGNASVAWSLLDEKELSVKLEMMPPGEKEALHYHRLGRQFFYVLKGIADVEIEGTRIRVNAEEGIRVEPYQKHRIMNPGRENLEFILCSQPSVAGDRINMTDNEKD